MKKQIFLKIAAVLTVVGVVSVLPFSAAAEYVPSLSAKSAVLINADTGTVLYEKNADEKRAIASTTKIMTALLTLEAGDLDRQFKVDDYAIMVEGTTMGLQKGDIVTRRALCYGMLLPSGNDAAQAGAVSVSGSISEFAKLMNSRAKEIGMKDTNFVNPSGLDADGHLSTAYDMALLTAEAMKNPTFASMCNLQSVQLEFGNPPYKRWLKNNNKLLYMYDGCVGVKTGFTDDAKRCLVSAAQRDGVRLIAVTLNDPDDWKDHSSLFDYGFEKYSSKIIDYDVSQYKVNVVGGEKQAVGVQFVTTPAVNLLEQEMAQVSVEINVIPFLYGGFDTGTEAGTATFFYQDTPIKTVTLVTCEPCLAQVQEVSLWERVKFFLSDLL